MIDWLAILVETAGAIGHQALALGFPDLPAQVGFTGEAEFTFPTLWRVQGNNVISNLDTRDTFADGLNDAAAFMAQNRGEITFGIVSGKRKRVGVTDAGSDHPHQNLTSFRRHYIHLFNGEWLPRSPGNGCF